MGYGTSHVTEKKDSQTVKIIAGSIAALGAAWLGSFLGVAGTVAGAGVAAAASSVISAISEHSLTKAQQRARDLKARSVKRPLKGDPEATVPLRISELAVGPKPVRRPIPRWKWVAASGAVFAIAMVALTLVEVGVGHPISGGNQGTTLTGFLGGRTTGVKPARTHTSTATPTTQPMIIPTISSYAPTSTTTPETTFTSPDFSHSLEPTTTTDDTTTTDKKTTTVAPPPSVDNPSAEGQP